MGMGIPATRRPSETAAGPESELLVSEATWRALRFPQVAIPETTRSCPGEEQFQAAFCFQSQDLIATTDAIPWRDLEQVAGGEAREQRRSRSSPTWCTHHHPVITDMPPPQHICSKRGGSPGETTVWQWNCRGYKNKHGSLIQYIAMSTRPPEIIALQETNTHVRLPGYVTYGTDTVRSQWPFNTISNNPNRLPLCSKKGPMFVLNAYCRPKSTPSVLKQVLEQASHAAGNHPLLIVGDFNAAHPLWGYTYTNPRGNLLHKVIGDMDLTLVYHPRSSTRLGRSVTRDKNPDFTLTRNIRQACCTNLQEYLGSDHALLATTLHGLEYKARIGTARLTDWTKLREMREELQANRANSFSQLRTGSLSFTRM
ncbi:hypothetical protein HPB49_024230 [Dermacentor silvarum]|uniref:Uncharacterized protein n=1 Tax=Dermacentor silvarum TaxID=543639 RepID=A0ACB8D0N5_DERSI|nr:hypothetical protein HPB49_024230 [Dermacentor silvarum]